jgi:nucleotide-binding universal stress UspA family protein
MATIFVAYGDHDDRESVLSFAAERAAASGDDLYVYHAQERGDESSDAVREEVAAVMERTAPDVAYETVVDTPEEESDLTNVSTQKRLLDAVLGSDREFAYVVMGNIEHGTVERFVVPSMTEAVLESRGVPVVLVPV